MKGECMLILKKIWKFLDNKKSAIGATVNAIVLWVFTKGWLDQTDMMMVSAILSVWTGLAVYDHTRKGISTIIRG